MLESVTAVEITLETHHLICHGPHPPNHVPNFRPINNFPLSCCFFEANRAIHISKLGIRIQISCLIRVCDSLYWPRSSEKVLLTMKSKLHISNSFYYLTREHLYH